MSKTAEEIKAILKNYVIKSPSIGRDVIIADRIDEIVDDLAAAPPPASEGVLTGEDYRNLIDTHIGRMGELEKASIKHFIETGTISGSFNLRLVSLINFAISLAKGKAALATLPTREPEERKFSQSEIEALQSSIYEITGAGEVMELFNKMLGVNAG